MGKVLACYGLFRFAHLLQDVVDCAMRFSIKQVLTQNNKGLVAMLQQSSLRLVFYKDRRDRRLSRIACPAKFLYRRQASLLAAKKPAPD